MKKRIYIVYTGGTIGMKRSKKGYLPAQGFLKKQMESLVELNNDIVPDYDLYEYEPLLDSANMTVAKWVDIATEIKNNYNKYVGFVVLHGTDTMAYSASALSFMLQGLKKPVIFTGSQIPLFEVRNDARANLVTAMIIAANYDIGEVCIYFAGKLLRGSRSVKKEADQIDAFTSPNYPKLAQVGVDIKVNWDYVLPKSKQAFQLIKFKENAFSIWRFFPGVLAEALDSFLKIPLKGLVLETYGIGTAPTHKAILKALNKACARGMVIVACTQCWYGGVKMGKYLTASLLADAGVISGGDMTTEATLCKLYYLFSQGLKVEEIKEKMQVNICGELSEDLD